MIRTINRTVAAVLLAAGILVGGDASAAPITGGLSFSGLGTASGASADGATTDLTFDEITVTEGEIPGSFAGVNGAVTFTNFSFIDNLDDAELVGAPFDLFSIDGFTFTLTELDFGRTRFVAANGATTGRVNLSGSGIFSGNGFTDTYATFTLSGSSNGPDFTFEVVAGTATSTGNEVPGVPDGGSTAILLGSSMLGLAYVRNRFALLKA